MSLCFVKLYGLGGSKTSSSETVCEKTGFEDRITIADRI